MSTLHSDVTNMRSQIKHAPEQVDLYEVRGLLGRVEDALEVLGMLTWGADMHFVASPDDPEGWDVTVSTSVSDRRPLFAWMSGGDQ